MARSADDLLAAIRTMQQGDMPDFGAPMQAAHDALAACDAGQKHIIMISDSDPAPPSDELLAALKKAGITASGVAVAPHNPNDMLKLVKIARDTGGRFYHVQNAGELPQIFIKEARTVTRTLIQEEAFTPALARGLGEIVRGLGAGVPRLNGYVLTGPKGGLAELLMTGPEDDPVLASSQVGLGRAAAFTSSADARWAGAWVAWGGYARFWEQVVRWTARSAQAVSSISPQCRSREVSEAWFHSFPANGLASSPCPDSCSSGAIHCRYPRRSFRKKSSPLWAAIPPMVPTIISR